ncbi:MAG: hypothetical protein JXN65_03995 [Clostridia bacterium]|nr:hypothetical protein [Clostridia bacterium]
MNRYNDVFHEEIIVRKNKGLYNFLYIIFSIMMWISLIFTLMGLQGIMQAFTGTVPFGNALVLFFGFGALSGISYLNKNSMRIDYEYSFTNGVLDIAQVKNNTKRKEILSIDTKEELELIAPIMTDEFLRYQCMNDIKRINAWLNRDIKKHFAVIKKDGQRIMLVFEPSENMINTLKKYNPQKVKTS